jgi:hypothetical protein
MIDIGKILKRSWHILWDYRILWIFGILLALTTGGGNSGNSNSIREMRNNTDRIPGVFPEGMPQWARQFIDWLNLNVEPLFTHPEQHVGTLVIIGVVIVTTILLIGAVFALVRYPSETAVIRMVDEYEQSGSKLSFRHGWKLGWTRRAFRIWLIDLLLSVPMLAYVLMIALGLIVYFNVAPNSVTARNISVFAAVGLGCTSLIVLILWGVFLNLLRNFFARAAALDDLGVIASIQYGWAMLKRNWKSAGVMWLVMVGIGIGFGILGLIAFFLLIPVYLVLILPAALTAAVPALIAFGFTSIFASGPLAWIIAFLVAIPFFFIILFAPLSLLSGWYTIYASNVWTLTYREMKALEAPAMPVIPVEGEKSAEV